METTEIWKNFNEELYFFILKKVSSSSTANDVFQNTFLKIHKIVSKLKNTDKIRPWIYQIARNEILNHYSHESNYRVAINSITSLPNEDRTSICCFDKLIEELPGKYREVIERAFIKGQKQADIALELNISLESVKARIRRSKEMLKLKFSECGKYEFNKNNKLVGRPDCPIC